MPHGATIVLRKKCPEEEFSKFLTKDMQDYQATLARARNPAGFLIAKLSEMEKVLRDVGKQSRLTSCQFLDLTSMQLLSEIHEFTSI